MREDIKKMIKDMALDYLVKFDKWRYGQSVFNATYALYPDVANKLRATNFDCFYDDTKVEEFLNQAEKIAHELS